MLKVLHLINYPGKGGTERYILSLAEKLHGKSCKFYLGYSEEGPMIKTAKDLGIKTVHIPMRSPYDLKAALAVKEVCRKFSVDVVHTHFLRENYISIFSRIAGNKAALVNTHHMLTEKNMILRLFNRLFTPMDDRVIAVSGAVRDRMTSEGILSSKIEVIYNGVDADYWAGTRSMKFRKELGISRDDFVITSVARFSEEKGHVFLLEAIKHYKKLAVSNAAKIKKNVKFVLVGDGELFGQTRKLAGMLGVSDIAVFTGYRTDLKKVLLDSDLYVSHSKSEALGISILEALACGLPVVATDAGGPAEIVNNSTRCGILTDYGNTEQFAAAILKLVTDKKLYVTLKDNTAVLVRKKFNLDKTAQETYNLYNRCIELRKEKERSNDN
jgi:glycosyltransferase involved in cell wall biosynthesis